MKMLSRRWRKGRGNGRRAWRRGEDKGKGKGFSAAFEARLFWSYLGFKGSGFRVLGLGGKKEHLLLLLLLFFHLLLFSVLGSGKEGTM